ncbi:MAG: hypothetical protein KJ579_05565, partial [Verrucomicrobia bacterium]|nr:hypothetical protein [Verrucomicrobiota bacterium]
MKSRLLESLGSLRITVAGLLLLLVLTVWGTLYQVDHGLYQAQERFYQSWAFLAGGFLPFPGAQLVMVALFVNLAAAMLARFFSGEGRVWMLVTHLGLMLMLAAGAVTFYFGQSAHLSLAEGEASNVAMAYSDWEFAVLPDAAGSRRQVSAFDAEALVPGRILALPAGGLSIRVEKFNRHCEAGREVGGAATPVNASGFATLSPLPRRQEPAENLPGVVFTLLENGR